MVEVLLGSWSQLVDRLQVVWVEMDDMVGSWVAYLDE